MVSPFRRASVNCSSKYGLFLCPVGSVHTHVRRPSHTTYIRHRIAVAYPNNYFLSYGMDYVCYRNGYGGRFFVRHAITNIVQDETRSEKSGKVGGNRQMGEARIIHRISNHNRILVQHPGIRAGADDLYDMVCNLPAYYRSARKGGAP